MLLGIRVRTTKKPMADKSPTLLPPPPPEKERSGRTLFLYPEMWDELTEAAEFHTETFRNIDKKNPSVSRNDLIENFLEWALEAYWEEKSGKPKSEAERKQKAAAFAERLKKQQAKPSSK